MRIQLPYLLLFVALFSCKSKKEVVDKSDMFLSEKDKAIKDTLTRVTARGYLIDGITQKINGNFEVAYRHFETCIKLDPNNDAAYHHLSEIQEMMGKKTEAIANEEKALTIDPKNEWYLIHLGYLYREQGNHAKSLETFSKLIKIDPNKKESYFYLAEAQIYAGEIDKAIETLNKIEKMDSFNEDIVLQKFRIYSYQKKYDLAELEIQKLIKRNPYDATNYGLLAEMYESKGDFEKAKEYYDKILKTDPSNGLVHYALSNYYKKKGDNKTAFEEMKLAFESNALEMDQKLQIVYDYYDKKNDAEATKEATALLDILTRVNSNDARSFSIYGDFLVRDNKLKEAREKYLKAIEVSSDLFQVWNQLLVIDSNMGDPENLYKDSRKAMELFPMQASFYYFNGMAASQRGMNKEAVETLNTGKDLIIDDKALLFEFWQLLGDAYYKISDFSNSDRSFDEALKIDPNNTYVLNNYSYYLSVRKIRLEKAAEMSKKSNELKPNQPSFEDTYGWILFVQNNYTEAEKWIGMALSHGGSNSGTILEHYGDVLYKLDRKSEALDYWKKAKEKGGTSTLIDKKISDKKYYE